MWECFSLLFGRWITHISERKSQNTWEKWRKHLPTPIWWLFSTDHQYTAYPLHHNRFLRQSYCFHEHTIILYFGINDTINPMNWKRGVCFHCFMKCLGSNFSNLVSCLMPLVYMVHCTCLSLCFLTPLTESLFKNILCCTISQSLRAP